MKTTAHSIDQNINPIQYEDQANQDETIGEVTDKSETKKDDIKVKDYTKEDLIDLLNDIYFNKSDILSEFIKQDTDTTEEIRVIYNLFIKIKKTFLFLDKMIKYIIIQKEDYADVKGKNTKFPLSGKHLVAIVGAYYKAFDATTEELVLQVVLHENINDFHSISTIPRQLIYEIMDQSLQYDLLNKDFTKFSELVRDLACHVLYVNTDFVNLDEDDSYMIEDIEKEETQ